jgi:hypothetical protein
MNRISLPLLLVICACAAQAAESPCPMKIETGQELAQIPKGWELFSDPNGKHVLSAVSFYEGHPKEMADLAPDNEGAADGTPRVWTFPQGKSGKKGAAIWQVCRYTNTRLTLTRKIEADTKSCRVKTSKDVTPEVLSITCQ